MRVAHVSDIHWYEPPRLAQIRGKRVLGTANLYLRGRRHDFTEDAQAALITHLLDLSPDLVVVTGDLTAQALTVELDKARRALDPVMAAFPTLVLPGNHDIYTRASALQFGQRFAPWMHLADDGVARLDLDQVTVIGLDPCRPWYSSAGRVPDRQLRRLAMMLDDDDWRDRFVVLALHYPIVNRYGGFATNPVDGLVNAPALADVLRNARRRPDLVMHGHDHRPWTGHINLWGADQIVNVCCGTSGHRFDPRSGYTAGMFVYELDETGLARIERYEFDGRKFVGPSQQQRLAPRVREEP